MRPVKLTTRVFGYAPAKNDFLFEKRLQNYIFEILMQHSKGKSALVFCSTRKGAQEAAQILSQTVKSLGHSNPFIKSREQQDRLREASLTCSDKQMQSYMIYGVGYHNGGLCLKDRNLVESLFLKGDLQILCTTNTLAHGINLPAHTVVIKSTQHYNKEKGVYMEIDRSTLLQMCGRAGRPPFDDTGMVVIMTRRDTVHLYENLLNGCEMVESQLLSCLTEHLTAEIVQLSVSDITKAIEWMKYSFLYVRMKKNPRHYAIKKGISNDHIEKHMLEVCVQKVNELSRHQMVWTDEDGFLLKPLEPGRLMTKYYLKFGTMKYIIQTPVSCTLEDVLHVICRAEEISWIQLRRNEKKLLNDINTDKDGRLRFHILGDKGKRKKRIQTREEKIFLLANDCLTGDPSVHDLSLTQDMNSICSNGCRIARCMKEFFIYQKNYRGALNSMLLAKSMYQKLWDDSPYLLKQLPGIGMVTAKALYSMGVKSFETLAEADPRRIEIVTGRKYPFGNHIKESLMSLPRKVELRVEETEHLGQGKLKLAVTLTRLSPTLQSTKRHYADMIVGSEEDNLILFHEKIRVDEFSSPYSSTIFLPKHQQGKLTIKAVLIFEDYIGIDLNQELILMKESNLSANKERGRKKTSVAPPQEVCIIDDDTYEGPSEVLPKSKKSKTLDGYMPSFKLLDDDSEEDEVADDVHNDEIATKVQDGDKTVTQQTVFDHIREKAKNFPAVVASNSTFPPSSESLLLARRHVREKKLASESGADVPKGKVPRRSVVNPSSEPKEQQHLSSINNHLTPRGSASQNFMNDRGDTIFDHIRAKAKNFPVIGKPNVVETESLLPRKESPYKTVKEFRMETTAMRKRTEPNEVIKDYECDRGILSGSYCNSYRKSGGSPVGLSNGVDHSSSNMLSFNMSMFTNPKQPGDVGSTMENTRKKQKLSPIVPPRHCSMTAVGKSKQVETFLGFESVFSFL